MIKELEDKIRKIHKLVTSTDVPVRQICNQHNITFQDYYKYRNRLGLTHERKKGASGPRKKWGTTSTQVYKKIHQPCTSGMQQKAACEKYAVAPPAYHSWLKRNRQSVSTQGNKQPQTLIIPTTEERVMFFSGTMSQLDKLKEVFGVR